MKKTFLLSAILLSLATANCQSCCLGAFEVADIENLAISIYPNPSSGDFIIRIENDQKFLTARIFDTQGRLQMQQSISGNNQIALNTQLNTGMYLLQLSGEQKSILRKLIIQ